MKNSINISSRSLPHHDFSVSASLVRLMSWLDWRIVNLNSYYLIGNNKYGIIELQWSHLHTNNSNAIDRYETLITEWKPGFESNHSTELLIYKVSSYRYFIDFLNLKTWLEDLRIMLQHRRGEMRVSRVRYDKLLDILGHCDFYLRWMPFEVQF